MTPRVPVQDLAFGDLKLGLSASFQASVNAADIDAFARLSGDFSDLHVDDSYAQAAGFPSRVAHGMLCSSLYSTLVGVHLPGKRALLQGIELSFHAPVLAGEVLTVRGEVSNLSEAVRQAEIKAEIRNAAGQRVSKALIKVGLRGA